VPVTEVAPKLNVVRLLLEIGPARVRVPAFCAIFAARGLLKEMLNGTSTVFEYPVLSTAEIMLAVPVVTVPVNVIPYPFALVKVNPLLLELAKSSSPEVPGPPSRVIVSTLVEPVLKIVSTPLAGTATPLQLLAVFQSELVSPVQVVVVAACADCVHAPTTVIATIHNQSKFLPFLPGRRQNDSAKVAILIWPQGVR
jgi:hypothetical protein